MDKLSAKIVNKPVRPERVLQFGEGVFLRAFADEMIDKLNERGLFDGSIVIVPPTPRGSAEALNSQDCLYTVLLRGLDGGTPKREVRVVASVSRAVNAYTDFGDYIACARNPDLQIIISNTTEAGIEYDAGAQPGDRPQRGFPAKIAAFLYERFRYFNGDVKRGLAVIPCELIEKNGALLKSIALRHAREWNYGMEFETWVNAACVFADTLVDRIVSGYPAEEADALFTEFGYEDALLDTGELYHLWAIRADAGAVNIQELLPFHKAGLNVIYTDDVELYGTRKVRLLNGAHTALAACAGRGGFDFVREAAADPLYGKFLRILLYEEIPAALNIGSGGAELKSFADSVLERFASPFIEHKLSGIMLNASFKFKVRLLPSISEYYGRTNGLPELLCFSFAALIAYYRNDGTAGAADVRDAEDVLEFFRAQWALIGQKTPDGQSTPDGNNSPDRVYSTVRRVLGQAGIWGSDLNVIPGLAEKVAAHLENILNLGIAGALRAALVTVHT